MDPLAHTLVGATLAETRLKRLTPLAVPVFVLGANAPDIDALTMFAGGDFALGFRRGWTHGLLALAILPVVLTGLLWLIHRWWTGADAHTGTTARGLLVACYLAVLTHPALDWLNTYGIRLLMPFDGRWFYGDALFIIDPWVWLLAGGTVAIGRSQTRSSAAAWAVLGLMATVLVTSVVDLPPAARLVWIAGLTAIVSVRAWNGLGDRRPTAAAVSLVVLAGYMVAMRVGSMTAERQVRAWLADRQMDHTSVTDVMAGPVPANPFVRDVIVMDASHYHFLELNWLAEPRIRIRDAAIPIGPRGPITEAALSAPEVRGLRTWMRFPSFDVVETGNGYRVTIRDVRYARLSRNGIGSASVELDRELRPK